MARITLRLITVPAATTPSASGKDAAGFSRLVRANVKATPVDEMKPPINPATE